MSPSRCYLCVLGVCPVRAAPAHSFIHSVPVAAVVCAQTCFACAVVLTYFLFFSPSVRRLNVEMRNTRAVLLMFPDEIVNGIPAIRTLMKELYKSAASK